MDVRERARHLIHVQLHTEGSYLRLITFVSPNSRLESNTEEEEEAHGTSAPPASDRRWGQHASQHPECALRSLALHIQGGGCWSRLGLRYV